MSNRIKSLELLKTLQPFTQAKIISPQQAQEMVKKYAGGDTDGLRKLVNSPDIPVSYSPLLAELKNFL